MREFYLPRPVNEFDDPWGVSVMLTGRVQTPDPKLNLTWTMLEEEVQQQYRIIYITKGEGWLESNCVNASQKILPGTILFLFPGNGYKLKIPEESVTDEYLLSFKGKMVDSLIEKGYFNSQKVSFDVGYNEYILNLFIQIIETTKAQRTGYQHVISGATMHLLGYLHAVTNQHHQLTEEEEIIKKSKFLFKSSWNSHISAEEIASQLQVSYSRFRKIFKQYTGMAPGQYQINLKLQKAKELLINTVKPIKEIAYTLGFESNFYFLRLFKEKTGTTPTAYRDQMKPKPDKEYS